MVLCLRRGEPIASVMTLCDIDDRVEAVIVTGQFLVLRG